MPYIQPEVIVEAKKVDLLTYLQNYEPQELVHVSGGEYTTKTHDSLRISNNGLWNWCSQGIGGKTALDYLIKVKGFSFMDAVEQIVGHTAIAPPVLAVKKEKSPKVLILPQVNRCATQVVNYLENRRGIDSKIVDFCIESGRLYQSYPYHNVVFIGYDKQGTARYANLRGIGTNFKGEANGSDKRFSFGIPAEQKNEILHLFESAIDLLSYATLQKMDGKDWRHENLLSLAGIYQPKKSVAESRLPIALTQYLTDYPHIKKIVLRLDNDPKGRLAANTIKTILPKEYDVSVEFPPQGKDYNDCLCVRKGLPITARTEKEYAR